MERHIEALVRDYDRGAMSRRAFVAALGALVASRPAAGAAPFRANALNHVSLAVSDRERSRAFYESVLGCEVVSRQENGVNLGLGESFLGLYDVPGSLGIHHFCVGVDGFAIDDATGKLRGAGIEPYVRQDRPELYCRDPDDILVQLSSKDYRG